MPRHARVTLPGIPLRIIQHGNNRQPCFIAEEDYRFYLDWLGEYAEKCGSRIHAYGLMTNHDHLLLSGDEVESTGRLMKALGQRYAQYVNRTYRRPIASCFASSWIPVLWMKFEERPMAISRCVIRSVRCNKHSALPHFLCVRNIRRNALRLLHPTRPGPEQKMQERRAEKR